MNIIDTPLNNYNVFLRSSEYTTAMNGQKSNLVFELNRPITVYPNMDLLVSLESFNFTNSFYTVNDNNNILYYSFDNTGLPYTTIAITKGNYDIDTLTQYLNTAMGGDGFTVTYNPVTMKLQFYNAAASFRFVNPKKNTLNAYEMLGFDDDGTLNKYTTQVSPYVVNLMTTQVLHIVCPNLNIASIGLKNKPKMNILASVHINCMTGESQTYYNTSGFKYKLGDDTINFLNVVVYDQDFNLVDFNGVDWFINISFLPIYTPEFRQSSYLEDEPEGLTYEHFLREEEDRNFMRELANYFRKK